MNPTARSENLVTEQVLDEVVVYDLQRDKAHALNPMAAFVWQQCDGTKTPEQIAILVQTEFQTEQADEMVWMSLERLGKANLLEEKVTNGRNVLTRREMLKLARAAGVAAVLLPVVATIPAPVAAQTKSKCPDQSIEVTTVSCVDNMDGTHTSTFEIALSGGSTFVKREPYTVVGTPGPDTLKSGNYDLSAPCGCQIISVTHSDSYTKVVLTADQIDCHKGSGTSQAECVSWV
ncbi:MAG: PqqD family protein [Anaerolineae bacterium]|nr:PqqD family protein [Anaerolineae bacterium]